MQQWLNFTLTIVNEERPKFSIYEILQKQLAWIIMHSGIGVTVKWVAELCNCCGLLQKVIAPHRPCVSAVVDLFRLWTQWPYICNHRRSVKACFHARDSDSVTTSDASSNAPLAPQLEDSIRFHVFLKRSARDAANETRETRDAPAARRLTLNADADACVETVGRDVLF